MSRKEKLSLIDAANKRLDGTGYRVTEVYPAKLRKYGFVGQIMASEPGPTTGTCQTYVRRFGPEQLERLNSSNVFAAVFENARL